MIDRPDRRIRHSSLGRSAHRPLSIVIRSGLWAALFVVLLPRMASAQLSLQALSSLRYGELPRTSEGQLPSLYGDLIAEYRTQGSGASFLFGIRAEGFSSPEIDTGYDHISQRYVEASWSWGSARLGNVYGIFGKGVILRGFELPGFVYESRAFRKQHRVIRDFDGYKLTLTPGPVDLTVIGGTPVDPLQPPDVEDRRFGKMGGAQLRVRLPGGVQLGGAYLEHRTDFKTIVATRFLSWSADDLLAAAGLASLTADFYVEYATQQGTGSFGQFNFEAPHALYLSGNLAWGGLGLSAEVKDYARFDLGINDPPPLIRENSELLLNRATHVLNPNAETGYQIELFYSPLPLVRLTGNYSLARNDFGSGVRPLFQERYLGFEWLGDPWSTRYFVDSGQDEVLSEFERLTTGVAADYHLAAGPTVGFDLQWQRIRRSSPPFFDYQFANLYLAVRLQDWNGLAIALVAERSTDPDVTQSVKYYPNGSVFWQALPQVRFQFFAGKRRGGTACDHGYCIEVLDFEGTELRVEMRW